MDIYSQFIRFILLCLMFLLLLDSSQGRKERKKKSKLKHHPCKKEQTHFVKTLWEFEVKKMVPISPQLVTSSGVCHAAGDTSCCTQQMEDIFQNTTAKLLQEKLLTRMFKAPLVILEKGRLFLMTENYAEKVKSAEAHLSLASSEMYLDGVKEWKKASATFWKKLRRAGMGKEHRIRAAVEAFVEQLYLAIKQSVIKHLSGPEIDLPEDCAQRAADEIDMPSILPSYTAKHLTSGLQRSIALTMLVNHTFTAGADTLNNIAALVEPTMTQECKEAHTRLRHCGYCVKKMSVPVCHGFCLNTMAGCYSPVLATFHKSWQDYVALASQLMAMGQEVGSDTREVLKEIPETLVTVAKEARSSLSEKIIQKINSPGVCDHKKVSINTVEPHHLNDDPGIFDIENDKERPFYLGMVDMVQNLEGMLPMTPATICMSDASFSSQQDHGCWNGRGIGSYRKIIPGFSREQQQQNPEVTRPIHVPHCITHARDKFVSTVQELRLLTDKFEEPSKHGGMKEVLRQAMTLKIDTSLESCDLPPHDHHRGLPEDDEDAGVPEAAASTGGSGGGDDEDDDRSIDIDTTENDGTARPKPQLPSYSGAPSTSGPGPSDQSSAAASGHLFNLILLPVIVLALLLGS